jgi:site-specific recombinase XerD
MKNRRHLTPSEVERLLQAVRGARHEARDRCLMLFMYRHGLRVTEACGLRLSDIDLGARQLFVRRLKGGFSTTHPLRNDEIAALRAWLKKRSARLATRAMGDGVTIEELFVSERGARLTRQQVHYLLKGYGVQAGLPLAVHPHMLRHACGFALADQGADTRLIQDYLGHRSIQHTVRYTAANPARFERLWR